MAPFRAHPRPAPAHLLLTLLALCPTARAVQRPARQSQSSDTIDDFNTIHDFRATFQDASQS